MQLAVGLAVYVVVVGAVVDRALITSQMARDLPRLALWLWHACAVSTLGAAAAALLVLAHDLWEHGLAWLLHADKSLIHEAYAGSGEVPPAWNLFALLLLMIVLSLAVSICRAWVDTRSQAQAHQLLEREAVDGSGPLTEPGVALVAHTSAAIYCVAGSRAETQIIVTKGAAEKLDPRELAAAIAHERAHLAGHHHAMVVLSDSVHRLTRRLGLLRNYPAAVRTLIELAADDAAARRHGRMTVASALLEICTPPEDPAPLTLSLGSSESAERVRRLARGDMPVRAGRVRGALLLAVSVVVIATPVAMVSMPALELVGSQHDAMRVDTRPVETQRDFVHHR